SKKLLRQLPSEAAMNRKMDSLSRYSHQSIALMGASYLEHALEIYLRGVFQPMDQDDERIMFDAAGNGILGTFGAKIRIAYALGLVHRNPYRALLLINDIRNVFAHSLHRITFRNKLVAEDCRKLASLSDPFLMAIGLQPHEVEDPRAIYSKAVKALY